MGVKPPSLSKEEKAFIKTVWAHYTAHGRHDLPWRKTAEPYKILVSELMLQQTQVSRVITKYREFLKQFPSVTALAHSSLGEVLKAWQGLGYNRRAKFLWQAAKAVVGEHNRKWPRDVKSLQALPGIGSYTAGAVMNFAFNEPVPLLETNVRTVYLHHFFKDQRGVSDKELLPFIERTLDKERPREWNWALMDYGAYLKSTHGNANVRSASYKKQYSFKESNRYVRGAILKVLSQGELSQEQLQKELATIEARRIAPQLTALINEGMIIKRKNKFSLP